MGIAASKALRLLAATLVLVATLSGRARADEADEHAGHVITVVDGEGRPILTTGLRVHAGDSFIDPANRLWRIIRVDGGKAQAIRADLFSLRPTERALPVTARAARPVVRAFGARVVVYHTHSDESYVPTEGAATVEGKGGIYEVGARLAAALEERGVRALHRQENHNPHDHGAYLRSRRTAIEAMADDRSILLLDVHRDAAPAKEYAYRNPTGGASAAKVLIVIGRSNPAHEANLALARELKAHADLAAPGLVRGVYLGIGNYNQDISTQALLLEAGTEGTPREQAERGVTLLAAAIPPLLESLNQSGSPAATAVSRTAWRTIGWVTVTGLLLGGLALVLISGGWRPALEKLRNWRTELWDPLRRR